MSDVLAGAIIMGFALSGLYFVRFWRRTGDGLFLMFGCAFWLLALSHVLIAALDMPREEHSWVYVFRLVAFLLIILAIIQKNLETKKPNDAGKHKNGTDGS